MAEFVEYISHGLWYITHFERQFKLNIDPIYNKFDTTPSSLLRPFINWIELAVLNELDYTRLNDENNANWKGKHDRWVTTVIGTMAR